MEKEILLVKIHNAIDNDGKDYYEATKGNWIASEVRVRENVEYVAGIYKGKVLAVFKPEKWTTVLDGGKKRQQFDGIDVDQEVFMRIKEKEEQLIQKFGNANPVAYEKIASILS